MSHWRPLALLALFVLSSSVNAQPAADIWSDARVLTLRLSNFRFDPSEIVLEHGVSYRLHFVNSSSGGHDFSARDFFASARIDPEDRAKATDGRVEVAGEESVDVRLVAPSPGSYKVRCTHFMHSMLGMTGRIVVQ